MSFTETSKTKTGYLHSLFFVFATGLTFFDKSGFYETQGVSLSGYIVFIARILYITPSSFKEELWKLKITL